MNDKPYAAVTCPEHGNLDIDVAEYDRQMRLSNSAWVCPKCGGYAFSMMKDLKKFTA